MSTTQPSFTQRTALWQQLQQGGPQWDMIIVGGGIIGAGVLREAARRGILVEPDTHYYANPQSSRNCFRMGVTSIPVERIRPGVEQLRELMWELASGKDEVLDENDPDLLRGKALERAMRVASDPCPPAARLAPVWWSWME